MWPVMTTLLLLKPQVCHIALKSLFFPLFSFQLLLLWIEGSSPFYGYWAAFLLCAVPPWLLPVSVCCALFNCVRYVS